MSNNSKPTIEGYADQLFDLLVASPDGMTRDAIMAKLGITDVNTFHIIKRQLQKTLGTDTVTVVGDPKTNNDGGWTYSLQGDPSHPVAQQYQILRGENLLSRNLTSFTITKALRNGVDRRTVAGQTANRMLETQRRLIIDTFEFLVQLGARTGDADDLIA